MQRPTRINIRSSGYLLDGGTIVLQGDDDQGGQAQIILVQHANPTASDSLDAIPGRLYYNGELIPIRSDFETDILQLLRSAEFGNSADAPSPPTTLLIMGDDIRQVMLRSPERICRAFAARGSPV